MNHKNILIIRTSGAGDIIHTFPLLSAVRRKFPQAHIAWLVKKRFRNLLKNHPQIDEIIDFERDKPWKIFSLIYKLREKKFDLVLDPQSQLRTGLFALLSGAPVRCGLDWQHSRELNWFFINRHIAPRPEEQHAVEEALSLARGIGIVSETKEFPLPVEEEEKKYAQNWFAKKGIKATDFLVIISPGTRMINKLWPLDRYAELAGAVRKNYHCPIVLLWGPGEQELVSRIKSLTSEEIFIAPPTTLKQLVAFIYHASLLIGSDSGPLHIAAALKIPLIGLYGHTDPQRCGPYGTKSIVLRGDLNRLHCRRFACHYCKKQDCMKLISVTDVFETVEKMYNSTRHEKQPVTEKWQNYPQ